MATAIKDIQEDPRELALQEKVATGYQLEDVEEMTERYKNVLVKDDMALFDQFYGPDQSYKIIDVD